MAKIGGDRVSGAAQVQARERERQIIQFIIRGLSYSEIGRELGVIDGSRRSRGHRKHSPTRP